MTPTRVLTPGESLFLAPRRQWDLVRASSYGFTAVTVLALAVALTLLVWQNLPIWGHSGEGYFTGKNWYFRHQAFGMLPMLYGTIAVSVIALLLAGPIGIGAAVFAGEYLPARARMVMKLMIELLAGIPSVVYGLLGILILRNYVYDSLRAMGMDPLSGDSLLTAGLLLAVMVLPTVMTLADDALRGVSPIQRQAARGLGLSQGQSILFVLLPQAGRGLVAAVLLALGRALGEAIAVFLVVGRQDNQWPRFPFAPDSLINAGQTLASKLGGAETNIAYGDPVHWAAVVGLGLILLSVVITVTLLSAWIQRRGEAHV